MLQIILIIVGLLVLAKGKLKVSSSKILNRPESIYLGILLIVYGIFMGLPPEDLIYQVIYYISLVGVASVIISRGESISQTEMTTKPNETIRNTLILIVFVAIVVVVFYFYSL